MEIWGHGRLGNGHGLPPVPYGSLTRASFWRNVGIFGGVIICQEVDKSGAVFFLIVVFLWYHIGYQVKQRALIVDIDFLGYC